MILKDLIFEEILMILIKQLFCCFIKIYSLALTYLKTIKLKQHEQISITTTGLCLRGA